MKRTLLSLFLSMLVMEAMSQTRVSCIGNSITYGTKTLLPIPTPASCNGSWGRITK